MTVPDRELEFGLPASLHFLPLEESVGGNYQTPLAERLFPEARLLDSFRAGVKEQALKQFEPSAHQLDPPFPVWVEGNHGLHRSGNNVSLRLEVKLIKTGMDGERLRAAVFAG